MGKKTKDIINKFMKIFLILVGVGLVINILIIAGVYMNHRLKLNNESGYLTNPPGEMYEVNGHMMHVYKAGEGNTEYTLVFMHNTGVSDTSVSLQPLLAILDDEYSVCYVDRSGTGYSEVAGVSGDIDTQLDEMEKALDAAGIKPPYVLCPNGNSGLLATYWADMRKDEVIGIIGISSEYAEEYDGLTTEEYCSFFKWVVNKGAIIGAERFVESVKPVNMKALYTENQMSIRKALIYRNYFTDDMYNEEYAMVNNAAQVKECGFPEDVPCLMLISNVIMEPYISEDEYVKKQYDSAVEASPDFDFVSAYNKDRIEYYSKYSNVEVIEMAGPSEIYTYNPQEVAQNIMQFLDKKIVTK